MIFNRDKQLVPEFQYPLVYVKMYDGMPVYSFKTPMAGRGSTILQLLMTVIAMVVFGWSMENTQGWLEDGWRHFFVLGSFGFATFMLMKAATPKRAWIQIDSRDLTLKFCGKRHDLTAFEAFTVEPHPFSQSPRRQSYRNWKCVFGRYGPMGAHKMTLAELRDGDEQGEAGLIRAALDWCGQKAWEAHRQADPAPEQEAGPEQGQKPATRADDWPLDG
jgi:hypothetical protein